jgi:hypothetical protein
VSVTHAQQGQILVCPVDVSWGRWPQGRGRAMHTSHIVCGDEQTIFVGGQLSCLIHTMQCVQQCALHTSTSVVQQTTAECQQQLLTGTHGHSYQACIKRLQAADNPAGNLLQCAARTSTAATSCYCFMQPLQNMAGEHSCVIKQPM